MIIIIEAGAVCEARTPVEFILGTAWMLCGRTATARHEYTCPRGHSFDSLTCPEHAPPPEAGLVGCGECWNADRIEVGMSAGPERPL